MMGFGDAVTSAGQYADSLHLHSRQITTSTRRHSFFTGQMLFQMRNQQCPSTKGNDVICIE